MAIVRRIHPGGRQRRHGFLGQVTAVLREGERWVFEYLPRPVSKVAICDLRAADSSRDSRNMKVSGNLLRLRLTASLSRLVGTPYDAPRSRSIMTFWLRTTWMRLSTGRKAARCFAGPLDAGAMGAGSTRFARKRQRMKGAFQRGRLQGGPCAPECREEARRRHTR
jgi:hypothetical protein